MLICHPLAIVMYQFFLPPYFTPQLGFSRKPEILAVYTKD